MYLTKVWYVKNLDMLKLVREVGLEQMMHFTSMSRLSTHQDICFPEQGSSHVYIIMVGHVKLSRLDENGHPVLMDILNPGEIFGKLTLDGDDIPNEFAEGADDVTVCLMGRTKFEMLLACVPGFHFHLAKRFDNRLEEYEEKVSDLVFKDATRRIINFFARYGERFDGTGSRSVTIERPLSAQDIANLTGTSTRTVATVLDQLQENRLVGFPEHSLVIHDLDSLTKLGQ
jgi:CRP/FNR family transcriptional regulator, cyclic AMP receptor protein